MGRLDCTKVNPLIYLGTTSLIVFAVTIAVSSNYCILPAGKAPCRQNTIALQEAFPINKNCVDGGESSNFLFFGRGGGESQPVT